MSSRKGLLPLVSNTAITMLRLEMAGIDNETTYLSSLVDRLSGDGIAARGDNPLVMTVIAGATENNENVGEAGMRLAIITALTVYRLLEKQAELDKYVN
ncbi:MAG: hypothetical protein AABW49_01500 [Nanoarchaeota archaeon]